MPILSATHAVEPITPARFEPAGRVTALAPGAVHVWRASLDDCSQPRTLDVLSRAERARARRIVDRSAAERFSRARAILRLLLGDYLQQDPGALCFELGPHGKPALAQGGPAFNLSHSGHLALYAFSAGREIGIDLELLRPRRTSHALAARILGPARARQLDALPPAERERELLRSWVRHEASLKYLGVGIGGAPALDPCDEPAVVEIDLDPGALGALASGTTPREVRFFDWPGWPESA